MISHLHALYDFLQTSGLLPLLDHWQGLIAGLLGLLAGIIAFVGALIAACLQVRAMRRVARETDRRRHRVITRAVKAEGRRLETVATEVQRVWSRGDPIILDSPLLRGEREDAALLDDTTFDLLEQASHLLNKHNASMKTLKIAAENRSLDPDISPEMRDALDNLIGIARKLQR